MLAGILLTKIEHRPAATTIFVSTRKCRLRAAFLFFADQSDVGAQQSVCPETGIEFLPRRRELKFLQDQCGSGLAYYDRESTVETRCPCRMR